MGQYKPSAKDNIKTDLTNGFIWHNFSEEQCPMDTNLETITELIFKVYEKMEKRISVYEDLSKTFNAFGEIEIPEENDEGRGGGLMM
jgi:hypothetical protein